MEIQDYEAAAAFLAAGRNKTDRPIENNTRIHRLPDGRIAVRLHATDVVIYEPDGTVELHNGGWYSMTSKDRLNAYAPKGLNVSSDRGRWNVYRVTDNGEWVRFAEHPEWDYQRTSFTKLARFFDGIRIRDGQVLNPRSDVEAQEKAENEMTRRIDRYVDGYLRRLDAGMDLPGPGDCWDCAMVTEDGTTLGDLSGDGHLREHMRERYYVPSLLWNAVKEHGYRNPDYVMSVYLDQDELKTGRMRTRLNKWSGKREHGDFRRELRTYLRRRLLPELAGKGPTVPGQPMSVTGYYR